MKYFTPELYQQFNSFDVDEAERADEAWDRAEVAYKERLASIRRQMPSQVVRLSELCLAFRAKSGHIVSCLAASRM